MTLDALGYAEPLLIAAGTVAALLAALLIWRFLRTGQAHTRVGTLAVVIATALTAEGMWEVTTDTLGLGALMALCVFGTFEIVTVAQGLLAKYKLSKDPGADVRKHMTFVWLLSVASGLIVATAGSSVTEILLRLVAPFIGAGIWWMTLTADRPAVDRPRSSWIWTPQYIGVRLGLLRPGSDAHDLDELFRQRRVAKLVRAGAKVAAGGWLRRRAVRRLQRLAQTADARTVAEAREYLQRSLTIDALLLGPAPELTPEPVVEPSVGEPLLDPWAFAEPVREPVARVEAEPVRVVREPVVVTPRPRREPVAQRVMPRSLTAAQRVIEAHEAHPDATHERIAELAGCSVSTVKRHRPERGVTGSPSTQDAAETAPDVTPEPTAEPARFVEPEPTPEPVVEQVNGHKPDLVGAGLN